MTSHLKSQSGIIKCKLTAKVSQLYLHCIETLDFMSKQQITYSYITCCSLLLPIINCCHDQQHHVYPVARSSWDERFFNQHIFDNMNMWSEELNCWNYHFNSHKTTINCSQFINSVHQLLTSSSLCFYFISTFSNEHCTPWTFQFIYFAIYPSLHLSLLCLPPTQRAANNRVSVLPSQWGILLPRQLHTH